MFTLKARAASSAPAKRGRGTARSAVEGASASTLEKLSGLNRRLFGVVACFCADRVRN